MIRHFQFKFLAFVLAATTITALVFSWTAPRIPLPIRQPATIAAMRARLYPHAHDLPETREFDVPESHFTRILANLSGARVDRSPAKWQTLGELSITGKDSSKTIVHLYLTKPSSTDGELAFSCDETYYRGGSAFETERALIAAKAADGK